uniref:Viral protein 91 kDa/p95 n=1 Tax=Lymantria dispar multicapsid nuclear polyhedrosis virus TaxID=10449 RepID=A0A1B1MR33_NPVLD|nr:viral protein 91 kDa/p95 [Lymantria dispar multiple nucleopolyhedrovirus]
MLTVSLLLAAIFVVVIFSIFYLIVYSEFDEGEFERRLRVTLEYMRRTNADFPLPPTLAYVSHINENAFEVTAFDTSTMALLARSQHDDTVETFNFLAQAFEPVMHAPDAPRVLPHPDDRSKFLIRGDDGWMHVDCPNEERFDETAFKCVPLSVCEDKTPGNYGLTESLINRLILNHRVAINVSPDDQERRVHPTMYLRCVTGGSHVVLECPERQTFDPQSGQCVTRNECENRPDDYVLNVFPAHLNADEYLVCLGGQSAVRSCGEGRIFDRRLLQCVSGDPCQVHGVGHTYITDDIGPAQYFECLNSTESQLITCINRVFVDQRYSCSGDSRCAGFPDGSGATVFSANDDTFSFDTGAIVCDEFEVVRHVECDTRNLLADKLFNDNRFAVSASLPRQVYDSASGECVPFSMDAVVVNNSHYGIESVVNDPGARFETAFVGVTSRIETLIGSSELVAGTVEYARDKNAIGLNFFDVDQIVECGAEDFLFDPFEGRRLNVCRDQEPIDRIVFKTDEYYSPNARAIRSDADYEQDCARAVDEAPQQNFVVMDHFQSEKTTDISQNDVCALILNDLHQKYTTERLKYRHGAIKYTNIGAKPSEYIEGYGTNISSNVISRPELASPPISNTTRTTPNDYHHHHHLPKPFFVPFDIIPTVAPMFNPFAETDEGEEQTANEGEDQSPDEGEEQTPDEGEGEEQTPPTPELTLAEKRVDFLCYYSLPLFKATSCTTNDEHIQIMWRQLLESATAHPDCANAIGLVNIINSYAYLGDDIKCRSRLDPVQGLYVDRATEGAQFDNLATQSNDGVVYNTHVHERNGTFMACPPALFDRQAFTCQLEDDKIYHMMDLQ